MEIVSVIAWQVSYHVLFFEVLEAYGAPRLITIAQLNKTYSAEGAQDLGDAVFRNLTLSLPLNIRLAKRIVILLMVKE